MGFPNSSEFSDRVDASVAARSCPLESTPMVDPTFNEVYCLTKPNQNACFLAPDNLLLNQLKDSEFKNPFAMSCDSSKQELPQSKADKSEHRGKYDVTVDDKGEVTSVTISDKHHMYKMPDGKWIDRFDGQPDKPLENVKIDSKGNLTIDVIKDGELNQFKINVDGSHSRESKEGLFVYDAQHNLLESPSGEGRVRKYHYTDGQLDQIDGNLGHWDRVVKDGQVSWVNKDSGAVWEGEMGVNDKDELEYRGRNGIAWNFTPSGQDVQPVQKNN